jgi:hypothetical protein
MATTQFKEINQHGQGVWMGNWSSGMIKSGEFPDLVKDQGNKTKLGSGIYDVDIAAASRAGLLTYKIYESLTFADICNTCDTLRLFFAASNQLGCHSDRHIDGKIDAKLKKSIDVIAQSQRWTALVDALIGQNTVNTPLLPTVASIDHGDVASLKNPNTNINKLLIAGIDQSIQPYQSLMNSLKGKVKLLLPA